MFGDIARSHAAGKVRFLPLHYSGIWDYLAGLEIDLALIQVTPPDRAGRCSLGVSVHFVPAVLDRAKAVVAEVNAAMPRPRAATRSGTTGSTTWSRRTARWSRSRPAACRPRPIGSARTSPA